MPVGTPTPDEIAAYEAQVGAAGPTPINPLRDLSAEDLSALAVADKSFIIVDEFQRQPELHADPATVQKVADAFNQVKQRGFKLEDLPTVPEAGKAVLTAGSGLAGQLWNYASAAGGVVAGAVTELLGNEELAAGYSEDINKRLSANISGTEEAMTGLSQLAGKGVAKAGRATGITKALTDYTPEERVTDLFNEAGRSEVRTERLTGKGEFTKAVTGEEREQDPEQIAELAAGDPSSFFLFGKAANIVGTAGRALVPQAVKGAVAAGTRAVEQAAEKAIPAAVGKTLTGAGVVADVTAKGVEKFAEGVGSIAGAAAGATHFGIPGAIVGVGSGAASGAKVAALAKWARPKIQKGTDIGRQISGSKAITSAYAQGARDFLQALPGAAGEIAKGTALDVGLAAATAELPQDTAGAVGFGTAIGALGGARRIGGRVLSGQLIAPREYGVNRVFPSSGQFPAFDTMHRDSMQAATPGVRARLNAVRDFMQGAAPGADVFLARDAASAEAALVQAGVAPATARQWAAQEGVFTASIPGRNGDPRRVAIVRNVEAAPHEAFHVVQDVLGESANRQIDEVIRQAYATEWQAEGQKYANRLGVDPSVPWHEGILDRSGWGDTAAKEKIYQDIFIRLENETGAAPSPALVEQMARAEVGRVTDAALERGQSVEPNQIQERVWRDILTTEEATAVADRYIAREIAAENFDAIFKNQGPRLAEGKQLPQYLARAVGGLVSALGGDPLAGRVSEFGNVSLRAPVVEAVRGAARPLPEVAPRPSTPPVVRPTAPVGTPEFAIEAAQEARVLAEQAPETPVAGGTRSQRELLGEIAEAIAVQGGVKLNYLSAPGEPAAAITSNRAVRRSIIETFRTMPQAARALWEKTFFPDRVIRTRGGKYQVQGWAPEVFASNAHKLANFLADTAGAETLSPYPIDATTRTFTDAGWQELYADTQTFVQNQMRGSTGSGADLVVPRSVTEAGGFAPATRPGAVALDQGRADFINMLFNFKLPETPRIQAGRRPLNLQGQDVSAATLPGRVEVPVRPRGEFTGEQAVRQGIEGRSVLEVNPLRNQVEAAAQAANKAAPSFIEAVQKLNLENIIEVQGAPEQPQFRGNTLTLTAGFQAPRAGERQWRVRGQRQGQAHEIVVNAADMAAARRQGESQGMRVASVETADKMANAMFQPARAGAEREWRVSGQVRGARQEVTVSAADIAGARRQAEAQGMRVANVEAADKISDAMFQPEELADRVEKFTPEEFRVWASSVEANFTGEAHRMGMEAPSREFVDSLKTRYEAISPKAMQAIRAGNFDDASALASQAQFFREAYEAATGTASAGSALRRANPDYVAPFPIEATAQAQPAPADNIRTLADEYAKRAGIPYTPKLKTATPNTDLLKRVSDLYEQAETAPTDPAVRASYDALANETIDQYNAIVDAGYVLEPWDGQGEPYANSAAMVSDVRDNKHLYYFRTKEGFGGEGDAVTQNAMLEDSGVVINGEPVPVNDLFRAVHDFFGHAKEGHQFGPKGEFNAWGTHAEMFSDAAQGALAAETLAQNAFVNFGPHMRTDSGTIRQQGDAGFLSLRDRPFAEQKNIVVPKELIDEARAQFAPRKKKVEDKYELKPGSSGFSKAWILPSGEPVQLGGTWHHQWLSDNPDVAAKYNLDVPAFEGGDAEGVREGALKAGFARVNYDNRNGTLIVEARARDWRRVKGAVERMVESNLDGVDNMRVSLLDETATKTVDSQSAKLFNYDDAEKLQHLPFITEGEVRGQFQPRKPGDRLPDGTFWWPDTASNATGPERVVRAAVRDNEGNVYEGRVHFEAYEAALGPDFDGYNVDLEGWEDGYVTSTDRFVGREEAFQISERNNQVASSDGPSLEGPAPRGQFQPAGELELGVTPDTRRAQRAIRAQVVKAREQFPEAIPLEYRQDEDGSFRTDAKGKPIPVGMNYDLGATPLAKQVVKGKRTDAAKDTAIDRAYADGIKETYKEAAKNPAILAGANWYSLAREKLTKLFGEETKFFTELLGATSAQTDVATNFRYSVEAYNNFKQGKYDAQIQKYREGKALWEEGDAGLEPGELSLADVLQEADLGPEPTRAAFMKYWIDKHDLKPRKSNGTLYGANSDAVLKVLDGSWRAEVQGPKTPNFANNLSGDSFEATIDIWAARLLRRLGNQGNTKRWRILPKNEVGVTDNDFFLGQRAFRLAGDELKVSPDSLQAILWFAEKEFWDKRGWTDKAGAKKSDFNEFLDVTTRGYSERLKGPGKIVIDEVSLRKEAAAVDKPQLDFELE